MDYEKKYKEALELARVAAFNGHQSLMEGIFPELKESEDEKVREYLIRYIDNTMKSSELKSKLLSWLEKQNSKKHEEELEKAYKTADKVQYRRGYEAAMKEMEKQGEISPILSNSSNIGKNAWSEEDEEHYKACLQYFDAVNPDMVYYKDYQWLKSLKQRIGG